MFMTSFEPPTYSPGELRGQDDWLLTGSGTGGAFLVDDTFARTGSQSVRAQHPGAGTSTIHSVSRTFSPGAEPFFEMSAWFYMDASTEAGRYVGLQMGGGGSAFAGGIRLGMAIDGSGALRAGTAYSSAGIFGAGAIQEDGRRDDLVGRWIQMHMIADLVSGDATVTWSGLGTSAGASSVSANFNRSFADFSNITLINDFSTSSAANTLVWIDDLSARAFPTPGAVAVFGLAGIAAARRRR